MNEQCSLATFPETGHRACARRARLLPVVPEAGLGHTLESNVAAGPGDMEREGKHGTAAGHEAHHVRHRHLPSRFRGYFLAGVLIAAPLGITIYLAWLFIGFIDNVMAPLLPARYIPADYLPIGIPGLGLVLVVLLLTLIGAFAAGFVGRLVVSLGEGVVERMPVIRHVYSALKQLFETVLAEQSGGFRAVVLVEYPRRGLWSIGFITGGASADIQAVSEDELVSVLVPLALNPTSGVLLFAPRRELRVLDMAVEEGLKMVISAGLVSTADRRRPPLKSGDAATPSPPPEVSLPGAWPTGPTPTAPSGPKPPG